MAEQGSPADGPQAPQPPAAGPGSDAVAKEQAQPAGSPVQGPAAAAAAGGGTPPAGAWAAAEEEELQRRRRRAKWEAEQEAGRRWDLQRRLADISTDVEFLAREVERVRGEMEVPLPSLGELPEGERGALEGARRRRCAELLGHCKKVLAHITTHKWSWPFLAPVDVRQYPDYGEMIKTPMDFGTVKRRIDGGGYRHPDDFLSDIRLVFDNARLYNKPGSDVHVMANTLQERFEDRYTATVAPRVAEEAAISRHQQEEARRRHAEATGRLGPGGGASGGGASSGPEALEAHCSVLVKYIDEVSACVADARSAAASLCRPVSRQEKEGLVRALTSLPQDQFELAMGLVMHHHPGLQPYDDFGFDLDALDALTLRQIQSFVRACEAVDAEWEQRGEGPRPQVGWPGLVLGSGLRPYRAPAARRPKRQQAQQAEVKQEAADDAAQQQPQQPQQQAVPQPQSPQPHVSTLTPEEVAAAAAAAGGWGSMVSPLPAPLAGMAPVAASAVGPAPLAAAPEPTQQQQQQQQQQQAQPEAAPAAKRQKSSPGPDAMAVQHGAASTAAPEPQQLLAQMGEMLRKAQQVQSAATAAAQQAQAQQQQGPRQG